MPKLFQNRTKQLQNDIDTYLNLVEKAAKSFSLAVKEYLSDNKNSFKKFSDEIVMIESDTDKIRRTIRYKLYKFMLIPDARGDVLGLLENIDDIVDMIKKIIYQISIEHPSVPMFLKDDFKELVEISAKCAVQLVAAVKSFFVEIKYVNERINTVLDMEHQVDVIEKSIKRKLFSSEKISAMSTKFHLRFFTERIATISDISESVAERLSVYAIKRKI